MIDSQSLKQGVENWKRLINQQNAYLETRRNFATQCINKADTIRQALQNPTERLTALEIFELLDIEEQKALFSDLIQLASVGHSDIELVRQVILAFPRQWVLENIEKNAEPVLKQGTDEEYRRLLEFYLDLDKNLAQRLARQALEQDDLGIKEVGEDFNTYLNQ